jgi:hypothetical protein
MVTRATTPRTYCSVEPQLNTVGVALAMSSEKRRPRAASVRWNVPVPTSDDGIGKVH